MNKPGYQIRVATESDMMAVADLFRHCFSSSFRDYPGGPTVNIRALCDIFSFVQHQEPNGFFVAAVNGEVIGYCITPHSIRRLWWNAFSRGYVFRWIWHWLTGRYNLSVVSAFLIIIDKCLFALSPHNHRRGTDAQVLSIAVADGFRGHGIGKALLKTGLQYLTDIGVSEIKLEVRPDNIGAQKMYQDLQFEVVGQMPDRRGGWLVMIRRLDQSDDSTSDTVHPE